MQLTILTPQELPCLKFRRLLSRKGNVIKSVGELEPAQRLISIRARSALTSVNPCRISDAPSDDFESLWDWE